MLLKHKTLKHKYSIETILVTLALYHFAKSFGQINDFVNMLKATIAHIVYQSIQKPKQLFCFTKYAKGIIN